MKNLTSVYQSEIYKNALSEEHLVQVSDQFFMLKKVIKLPLIGKKTILEGRGNPSEEDIHFLKEMSKKYFYCTISPTLLNEQKELLISNGFKKVSNHTILLDLKKSEDELWKLLDKGSIRWGINFAKKSSLSFNQASLDDANEFYNLYKDTAQNGGFRAESLKFVISLINTNISNLFVVKHKTKIVAGGLILIDAHNNYSILDLTSSSEEGLKMQAMPFLYWNLILFSKSKGLSFFDLGGYDSEAKPQEKTYNINKFKLRFGGIIHEQPIYSSNWKYPFFRKILKSFRFLKGWYQK